MKRIHHSATEFTLTTQRNYCIGEYKPGGLWYTQGNEWKEWCITEQFYLEGLQYRNVLEVDSSNVLFLSTEEEVRYFHRQFNLGATRYGHIDWTEVKREWDGIEFNPYFYDIRFTMLWYSMLDVPSGCVWNLDCVRVLSVSRTDVAPNQKRC